MKILFSNYWILIAALWYFVNGILHDIFVLVNHKGKYDRELLRLLMDGHVLILSGAIAFVCFLMLRSNIPYAAIIGIITGVAMLVYCGMIFPFLKSFVTIIISLMLVIVSIKTM